MKKSAIALAVAAAMGLSAAAQADTTLYGSVRLSMERAEVGDSDSWDVVNNASRLGVKGSEDLGGGLSAIYQYEFGVKADDLSTVTSGGRLAYVGLKGGFGTVAIGRQWSPYYNAVAVTDIFNGSVSANAYYTVGGMTRVPDAVTYTSPSWGGFSVAGLIQMNGPAAVDTASTADDVDRYQLAASYDNGGLHVGAGYQTIDADDVGGDDQDLWGVGASFGTGPFSVAAGYYDLEDVSEGFDVTGEYGFGSNIIRAGYGDIDRDSGDDGDYWVLGFQHKLSNRTRVWVEYGDGEVLYAGDDDNNLSIGIRHDF